MAPLDDAGTTPATPQQSAPTSAPADPALTRTTTAGPVVGFATPASDASPGTHSWLGIPYAQPPVGDLRFRRARPAKPWTEPRSATEYGASPFQVPLPESFGGLGDDRQANPFSEDCLYLDVHRPATQDTAEGTTAGAAEGTDPLPVMVWFYGGAFQYGSAKNYPAFNFVQQAGVVHVAMNYRIGALGFLDVSSLPAPRGDGGAFTGDTQPGFESNVGLYDQIAALRWVRENIAEFGGDPENVTIYGESAGAMSVLALMCMPDAQGLFHRAIAQSPAPASVATAEDHAQLARQFARLLDPAADTDKRCAEAITHARPEELVRAQVALLSGLKKSDPGVRTFAPVADGVSLPDRILALIAEGKAAPVPLLIGTMENEGQLFRAGFDSGKTGEAIIPVTEGTLRTLLPGEAAQDLLAVYTDFPSAEADSQLGGDLMFWYPSTVAAESHAHHAPTWMYSFEYTSQVPLFGRLGATHGAEIPHHFGRSTEYARALGRAVEAGAADPARADQLEAAERDARFSVHLVELWSTFARTGVPTAQAVPTWPQYDGVERATMIIDAPFHVKHDPRSGTRQAWAEYLHHREG
ncbi:carboxylesterase/lipase family protein [Brevibacterium litoralis]|uniref:carboxylesterase/lipase family protein n=1 Tax=Brevibacterium litoralis TaxID=3138935 RepID=UPI0032EF7953